MPAKSKSRVARAQGGSQFPDHPAMKSLSPIMGVRFGAEEPVKIPDTYCHPTSAIVLNKEYAVSSDAAGYAVWGENHNLYTGNFTVTAGSTGTSTDVVHPQITNLQSMCTSARLVANKVIVTFIGASQTSSGLLGVTYDYTTTSGLASQTVSSLLDNCSRQVRADEGIIAQSDFQQEPRFETAGGATFMLHTFRALNFVAVGLPPSTVCFRVRVLSFIEYVPASDSILRSTATVEPPDPATMAAHGALSTPSLNIQTLAEHTPQKWKQMVNTAYHMVQPMLPYVAAKARDAVISWSAARAAPLMLGL